MRGAWSGVDPHAGMVVGRHPWPTTPVLVPGTMKERRTVRWIFEQCAAGTTYTTIALALNDKGSTSARGKPWCDALVKNVIQTSVQVPTGGAFGATSMELQLANPGNIEHRKYGVTTSGRPNSLQRLLQ